MNALEEISFYPEMNDLASKRADLEKVTGQELDQLAVLGAAVTLPEPVPMDARTWMDQARTDNATVRAQTAALAAAKIRRWSSSSGWSAKYCL